MTIGIHHPQRVDHATASTRSGGPLVVKLGGAAIDEPALTPWIWSALARLHASRPGGVVLVHGGGKAVDRMLDRLGLPTQRRDGIRLTPPEQIDPIVGVLAGSVNKSLVGWLQRSGTSAVGLCLGDGGLCAVQTARRYGADVGRVGEVTGGDPRIIHALLGAGMLPVISSIGLDADGLALNVNADEAAAGIATVLNASGLVLLTDVAGVLDRDGHIIAKLDAAMIEAAIADGTIAGGMIPKVRGAREVADACGAPVTIAAWNLPEAFEALAAGLPAGTTIVPTVGAVSALRPPARPAGPNSAPTRSILDEPELPALSPVTGGAA